MRREPTYSLPENYPPLGKGARESGFIMQERIRGWINPDPVMKPLIADRRITETKRDKFWDHSCARRRANPCPSLTQIKAPTHPHLQINQRVQLELEPILEPCRFGLAGSHCRRYASRAWERANKTPAERLAPRTRHGFLTLLLSRAGSVTATHR